MRWYEIVESASAGATVAGAMAPVESSLGLMSRSDGFLLTGKYMADSDPTPNTPREYKRNKHARGQFKNSPGQ